MSIISRLEIYHDRWDEIISETFDLRKLDFVIDSTRNIAEPQCLEIIHRLKVVAYAYFKL